MLVTQWQEAVTRKDLVETFTFQDFKEVQNSNQINKLLQDLCKILFIYLRKVCWIIMHKIRHPLEVTRCVGLLTSQNGPVDLLTLLCLFFFVSNRCLNCDYKTILLPYLYEFFNKLI